MKTEQEIKILQNLESSGMHVHVIDHSDGYKGLNFPIALLAASTHFVMQEDKIVHVGNVYTINHFALNLEGVKF